MPNTPSISEYRRYALLALTLSATACHDGGDRRRGAAGPGTWVMGPEPVLSIGEVEGSPEYLFARIADVRLAPDGGVVVGDGTTGTIRVFGPDGAFRGQMGGMGEGPGEFRYLKTLRLSPPDTVVAFDSRISRLTTFLLSGEVVATLRFHAPDGSPEVYLGKTEGGDHVLAWIKQGNPQTEEKNGHGEVFRAGRTCVKSSRTYALEGILQAGGYTRRFPGTGPMASPPTESDPTQAMEAGPNCLSRTASTQSPRLADPEGSRLWPTLVVGFRSWRSAHSPAGHSEAATSRTFWDRTERDRAGASLGYPAPHPG